MPQGNESPPSPRPLDEDEDIDERQLEALRNSYFNLHNTSQTEPNSPMVGHRNFSSRTLQLDLRTPSRQRFAADETTSLLSPADGPSVKYKTTQTAPGTPHSGMHRSRSFANSIRVVRSRSRRGSFGSRLAKALGTDGNETEDDTLNTPKPPLYLDDRMWYDQFTSTDWVHDSIADAFRQKHLRSRKDWRGRLYALLDGAQGWLLVAIIGIITAGVAYLIDIVETTVFDYKEGFCRPRWWASRERCCNGATSCEDWINWSTLHSIYGERNIWADYGAYVGWVIALSLLSCIITLQTKTSISSAISLSTLDENLAADHHHHSKDQNEGRKQSLSPIRRFEQASQRPPLVYYPAAGSGVAEVKVILSGFVLHGYLGLRTLVCKMVGLMLSVASGLSLGKEGPYVHIATCIGNVTSRAFPKYRENDGKRREVLAASAAAGVAVAFGAPIAGVLFSLEEVSYYFPHKTLFRTFFCCIAAALSLRFLDPYGTGKIVLFEVRYLMNWKFFEIILFILVGLMGGLLGALFIKASRFWAKTFRRMTLIKKYPIVEVFIVALVTGLISFWNRYNRLPVAALLFELSAPCDAFTDTGHSLCPTQDRIGSIIGYLCIAFVVKAFLTTVTFGIKVPAGIYVPSMVVGGLLGRMVGHGVQWLTLANPGFSNFIGCPLSDDPSPESCVVPGVYALVAAGATMCGVTRLSVTLAVILFELTGSLEHVLPFSLGVLVAKWTADALEPLSIYDLLTDMNAYPYLDAKVRPVFTSDLGDIIKALHPYHFIDISASPYVPASQLRMRLDYLHMAGEIDGGLPILRDNILVGLIPGPDLEFALDRLPNESTAQCLMSPQDRWHRGSAGPNSQTVLSPIADRSDDGNAYEAQHAPAADPSNFTPYIDPAPVTLDICSSMDLVFECFAKLGLRYICVLREGRFVSLLHKKAFVRYVKDVSEGKET